MGNSPSDGPSPCASRRQPAALFVAKSLSPIDMLELVVFSIYKELTDGGGAHIFYNNLCTPQLA